MKEQHGFYQFILSFSLQERERRAYVRYKQERDQFQQLTSDERFAKQIELQATYEIEKQVKAYFLVGIFFTLVIGSWHVLCSSWQQLSILMLSRPAETSRQLVLTVFEIGMGLFVLFGSSLLVSVLFYLNRLVQMRRKLLLIENIQKQEG